MQRYNNSVIVSSSLYILALKSCGYHSNISKNGTKDYTCWAKLSIFVDCKNNLTNVKTSVGCKKTNINKINK